MDSISMAIILCQIHVQAVEYILDDQTIKFKQISESDSFGNLHYLPQLQERGCV